MESDATRWRSALERFPVFRWREARENGFVKLQGECKALKCGADFRKKKKKNRKERNYAVGRERRYENNDDDGE